MQYEEALKRWGAFKLGQLYRKRVADHNQYKGGMGYKGPVADVGNPEDLFELKTITVEMNFNEGYACCGGNDPSCYCSFAESPSAEVTISGKFKKHAAFTEYGGYVGFWGDHFHTVNIHASDFNFTTVLQEILEVAGEEISL